MDIKCSKCGEILLRDVPEYNLQYSIHLCRSCSESSGLDICTCGRLMKITNPYVLNECECGHMTRKTNS